MLLVAESGSSIILKEKHFYVLCSPVLGLTFSAVLFCWVIEIRKSFETT